MEEANWMRLEEEKMLQIAVVKKQKGHEFMNLTHVKTILAKLTPSKGNHVDYLALACLDPSRKGWLSEEHIDLWVDYMWHERYENANWAMVSCYFVQILLQNSTPLFYANYDKYATPWSDVDQIPPLNTSALPIGFQLSSVPLHLFATNYISKHTGMSQLARLAISANSVLVKDMMVKLFERQEQMIEMQSFLHVATLLAESYNLLKELQDYELEKCRELMKSISETQLKVMKKISFIAKLRRQ
ncbi:hypothetical protein Tco_0914362 [Tanacetum coccineum]